MKVLFLQIAFGILAGSMYAQGPAIEWQESLGGSLDDYVFDLAITTDGGYIMVGRTASNNGQVTGTHGGTDWWVVKTDEQGDLEWQRTYGGSGYERASSVKQTIDGGYIVVGSSNSTDGDVSGNHGGSDFWVVRLDSDGNIDWQNSYGGSGQDEGARDVEITTDGNFMVFGHSFSNDGDVTGNHGYADFWLIKLDSDGNLLWERSYGGSGTDYGADVILKADGGILLIGQSSSSDGDVTGAIGYDDCWVISVNATGDILWEKSFGGSAYEGGSEIRQLSNGNIVCLGSTTSTDGDISGAHGDYDVWVFMLDSQGSILWSRVIGGSGIEYGTYIDVIEETGFIVSGYTNSTDGDLSENLGNYDAWIMRLNSSGSIIWEKVYGGSDSDFAWRTKRTQDNGYVMAGGSLSNDGDVSGGHGAYDFWLVKLEADDVGVQELHEAQNGIGIHPNPTNGRITVTVPASAPKNSNLSFFDASGRMVHSVRIAKNAWQETVLDLDLDHLPEGIYMVELRTKELLFISTLVKN